MAATPSLPRLVIIGSGWAGFYLTQYLKSPKYAITVISPRRTSAYTPLLASAACGLFNFYLAEEPVRAKSRRDVKFVKANVTGIDFDEKRVLCRPAFEDANKDGSKPTFTPATNLRVNDSGENCVTANGGNTGAGGSWLQEEFDLPYDILVIAPGCETHTFNTPGVAENALFMKNVSDAMAVRKLLFDQLEKASLPNATPEMQKSLLHIAIVGGGPTGIEMTAELDDLAQNELKDLYPDVADKIRISVYDVGPNILSAFDKKLYEYANEQLVRRHVDVETKTRIERVDESALYIQGKGRVEYGMLLWAAGNRNVALVEKLNVKLSEKGLKRILTDDHLRVFVGQGGSSSLTPTATAAETPSIYPDVYALGDAADVDGSPLPTTAEVAVQKARYLVDMFNARNTRSEASISARPFRYKPKQLVSYIGGHDGIIAARQNGAGEGWTGRSAWLAWRSGSIMWTRSWRNRLVIAMTWTLNYLFGKEIARM